MRQLCIGICLFLLSNDLWARDTNAVSVDVLAKASASWNGEKLPNYAAGTPEVTILRIVIPPKVQLPLHRHPVINAGVLLKGELTVVTEDEKRLHLQAGDAVIEVVDTWHYGKNEGDVPAEIIVFYAGTQGEPITLEDH